MRSGSCSSVEVASTTEMIRRARRGQRGPPYGEGCSTERDVEAPASAPVKQTTSTGRRVPPRLCDSLSEDSDDFAVVDRPASVSSVGDRVSGATNTVSDQEHRKSVYDAVRVLVTRTPPRGHGAFRL